MKLPVCIRRYISGWRRAAMYRRMLATELKISWREREWARLNLERALEAEKARNWFLREYLFLKNDPGLKKKVP